MAKYRKKPVVVEARQLTRESANQIYHWVRGNKVADFDEEGRPRLIIQTLEGDMTANLGDWIIRGVKGEFYPCKPDVFAATYEAVEEDDG